MCGHEYWSLNPTFYDGHDNGSGYVRAIKEILEQKNSLILNVENLD
jgi:hypothetical protein